MTTSLLSISHINYLVVTSTCPSMRVHESHNKQNSQPSAQSQHMFKLQHLNRVSTQEVNNRHPPAVAEKRPKAAAKRAYGVVMLEPRHFLQEERCVVNVARVDTGERKP